MIENKLITISKNNTFDKGWALVAPYRTEFATNKRFRALNVSDIVRAITKSTQVNLILSEPCLSSQIIGELEWVNRYIAINLIAKNSALTERYAQLKFHKVEIDESIDFNYIAIKGEVDLYALIADNYISVDEILNKVYFEQAKVEGDYTFLTGAQSVIFIDEYNDQKYTVPFNVCIEANVPTAYLVGTKAYKQDLAHKFMSLNAKLLCSQNVRNGILYLTNDGRIFCATITSKGLCVSVEIESVNYYVGQPFESLKMADVIGVKEIPKECYVCENGDVKPLRIAKEKVIERSIQIDTMEDFVTEQFDRSETDIHNQYCAEAEDVVYKFTLIPPVFGTDRISDIYTESKTIFKKWKNNFNSINIVEIINVLNDLELSKCGLSLLCDGIVGFNDRLTNIVLQYNYKNYYSDIHVINDLINYVSIYDYCKELFVKLHTESSGTKFDKFDHEIAGYKQTIAEKKALIEKGVEVLSNKRRIEILEKKIADLTAIKQRFSDNASSRDSKQLETFLDICRNVINGVFVEEGREVDSIGNVLASKEITKISKLETFIKTYLYALNQFLISAKDIIKQLEAVDIPTDYVVYEQDGKRVIAINSEREYYDTEYIRKHFDLHCLARR